MWVDFIYKKTVENEFEPTTCIWNYLMWQQPSCCIVVCFVNPSSARPCGGAKQYPFFCSESAYSLIYLPRLRAMQLADNTENNNGQMRVLILCNPVIDAEESLLVKSLIHCIASFRKKLNELLARVWWLLKRLM